VTEAGLKSPTSLTILRYPSVWKTKVIEAGANALKLTMPNLRINR